MSHESPTNEWNELTAAQRTEADYRAVLRGETFDCSTRDLEAARRDAMKAMVVGLPDPHQVAAYLETAYPEAAETLRSAWIGKVQPYAGAWRVEDNEHVSTLRAIGLVGWASESDRCLVGAFGNKVRQIMLCDWEEGDE